MATTTAYGATTGETYGPPLAIHRVTVAGERHYYSTQPHDGGYWVAGAQRTDNGAGKYWYQTWGSFWVGSLSAARRLAADTLDPAVTRIRAGKTVRRLISDTARTEQARRMYAGGLTTRQIGAQLETDPTTVARWLGDDLRRRGARPRPDVTDERVRELRFGAEKLSYEAIAARTGLSKTAVRQRIARLSREAYEASP
jgi:hypothetical protein